MHGWELFFVPQIQYTITVDTQLISDIINSSFLQFQFLLTTSQASDNPIRK